MRIQRISAKNFRTLKDVTVEFPTYYCTISGRNNAGKSNIVRIIKEFFETERFRSPFDFRETSYAAYETQWEKEEIPVFMAAEIIISRTNDAEISLFLDDLSNSPSWWR